MKLPKPLSANAQNTGMPQRRRKSSLRTAAGSLQEQVLDRLAELADDPTVVLPRCIGDEPRPLRKLRRALETMKAGRTPLAARFDRHLLGAVHHARPLADWEAVPRLLDAKVAGQRRFYLQRGHVERLCSIAVQNFDTPRVLLLGYVTFAKKHRLHVFALPDCLVCTGDRPDPPVDWFADLAGGRLALALEREGRWGCGHADRDRALLQLRGGPAIAVCAPCGAKAEGLHGRLRERYAGPLQKKPVDLHVLKADGTLLEPSREAAARYRAGIDREDALIRSAH